MFGKDLDRRRKIVKTNATMTVPNPGGPAVRFPVQIQIVTYGCDKALIAWFAEGLCDTMVWIGPINGDRIYSAVQSDVRRAYGDDSLG